MKWLSKFQDGGQLRKIIGSLTSLVKRAQNKDTEAVQQIKAILEDSQAAQLLDMVRQTAPELLDAMESIAQNVEMEKNGGSVYLHSLKCGGKSKKARKTKKAENGQELNVKPARLAKGKKLCPCSLKKIGGRIVEVDCDGNIVWNKQGGQMVIKAYEGLKIGGQTISGFSADHLKTADDIRQMQGATNDMQYYYDPSTKSIMSMKYGANGWEDPVVANFGEQNPVFGQGEGQINLWKDGYNLKTGLMPGQQVKRNYGYGVIGTTNTRANTANPIARDQNGNLRLQYGTGKDAAGNAVTYDNSSVQLTYTPAQMARMMRAQRQADYWSNREAGVSKDVAKNERKIQRRMDRNTVWGTQYEDYGGTDYTQASKGGDYQSLYQVNKKRQAAQAKVAKSVADVIQSNQAATSNATAITTVGAAPITKASARFQQGGWLKKFDDDEKVKKYKDGEKVYRKATSHESTQASPSIHATKEDNGYTVPGSYLGYKFPDMWKWDAIAPTNIKFPLLKELIGYTPKTDAPIGRLIRTFNIEGMPNDTSYIVHYKNPFGTTRYENIEKGEDGYDNFQQLFKQTLNE